MKFNKEIHTISYRPVEISNYSNLDEVISALRKTKSDIILDFPEAFDLKLESHNEYGIINFCIEFCRNKSNIEIIYEKELEKNSSDKERKLYLKLKEKFELKEIND